MKVSPKKALGQHFLTDPSICYDIAHALSKLNEVKTIVEVGPGTGALTKELIPLNKELQLFEVDLESVAYLNEFFPEGAFTVHTKDFLKVKLEEYIDGKFVLIGKNYDQFNLKYK
ncbi:MAG: 16S rRNA (adenine(1518)-N(6)/adenine(1519)-N(6))-dimethyltransferase, partial [Flavobacteriales bacterium]|nr:16S rRNA (adenine(1518)-N(6)/adenine(1519)-N(6))-dimethyltransferase [Flavobacteriales bacterium]